MHLPYTRRALCRGGVRGPTLYPQAAGPASTPGARLRAPRSHGDPDSRGWPTWAQKFAARAAARSRAGLRGRSGLTPTKMLRARTGAAHRRDSSSGGRSRDGRRPGGTRGPRRRRRGSARGGRSRGGRRPGEGHGGGPLLDGARGVRGQVLVPVGGAGADEEVAASCDQDVPMTGEVCRAVAHQRVAQELRQPPEQRRGVAEVLRVPLQGGAPRDAVADPERVRPHRRGVLPAATPDVQDGAVPKTGRPEWKSARHLLKALGA